MTRVMVAGTCVLVMFALLAPVRAGADVGLTNILRNPSFEQGGGKPDYWDGFGFAARNWEFGGVEGERCVSIRGTGMDSGWWHAAGEVPVEPNRLYRLTYWVRRDGWSHSGEVLAGLNLVNRRVVPGADWEQQEFFFRSPLWMPDLQFWLGQKRVKGTLYFDHVALNPAIAIHQTRGLRALALGAGESVVDGRYTAVHRMTALGTSDCRFLHEYGGRFDTDRWVLDKQDEVVYKHRILRPGLGVLDQTMRAGHLIGPSQTSSVSAGGRATSTTTTVPVTETEPDTFRTVRQDAVSIEVTVARCEGGKLSVAVSPDGRPWTWVGLGVISRPMVARYHVPIHMLPAAELFVRLKSDYSSCVEVTSYRYSALLPKSEEWLLSDAFGSTQYLAVLHSSPDLEVRVTDVGDAVPGGRSEVKMILNNQTGRRKLRSTVMIVKDGKVACESNDVFPMNIGSTRRVYLPYTVARSGDQQMRIMVTEADGGRLLLMLEGRFVVSPLGDARGGELLLERPEFAVWWCEPERKVGRFRPLPEATGSALRISAAGNEYEAAQLVLRPRERWSGCRVTATDLVADSGARLPALAVEIRSVDYVAVTKPTDAVGQVGLWPDPLLPVGECGPLRPGRNHPFWISVRVPVGTSPGDYCGELLIESDAAEARVPLIVHVWGFDLPEDTHVKTACGISPSMVKRYHNLVDDEDVAEVLGLYLDSVAKHRLTPFCVACDSGLVWEETARRERRSFIDFSRFDEEAGTALREWGFDGVALWLPDTEDGVPRQRPRSAPRRVKRGTPQDRVSLATYVHALQNHMEERGWLDKAYVYWFTDCGGTGHEFVRKRVEQIHRAAPKLSRLLTTYPDGNLYERLGLLSAPVSALDGEKAARRRQHAGERWWHLCSGARAPYFANSLDHYGTVMRLWLWATWKYGVDGIVVWGANYWTSEAVYPEPRTQCPWSDPMSWAPTAPSEVGARDAWGNGDGRLLYPPNRDPERNHSRILEPPVPSIRWELLRDGIEDFEYFWLLRAQIDRLKALGANPAEYREAEKLLDVPREVCVDPAHYAIEPQAIHEHRARLAQAIERLSAL